MDSARRREVIRGLRQSFQTDALLGVEEVPVRKPTKAAKPKSPATAKRRSAEQTAARPTSGPIALTGDPDSDQSRRLTELAQQYVLDCTKCHLSKTRNKVVFGQGNPAADLVFVGEAPGADEDRQGLAFVGRAGQLLTRMIEAMGLSRDDVFICNVLKCRPPDNRTPSADEIAACSGYLMEQLAIIRPRVIVALGAPAAQTLLNTRDSIGRLRGRFHEFYPSGLVAVGDAVKLMPTYHPAYLLRSPGEKGKAWSDLKLVMAELGLPVPEGK